MRMGERETKESDSSIAKLGAADQVAISAVIYHCSASSTLRALIHL